ncbi:RNA-binding E3 ubiquitin-protein ligase MEX3C [Scyliorhinus canicula]|uniref:RNA-binding E3 ubiquitin-protein ligase MEX3C n=1 Tax=Scyliorhinus canicula TaxID=7830 RepID=UPI0018F64873|nr:RNA-binding E3 ubiquitin-protein ligase MEX3C [Scyliorhinus canicula]
MPSSTVFTDMEREDGESGPLHIAMEQLTVFGLEELPPPPRPSPPGQHGRGLEGEALASSSPPPPGAGGEPLPMPGPPHLLQGPVSGSQSACPCPASAGGGLPLVSSVLALFEAEQIQLQQQQPRKKSVNMTECVPVPSSEHVAEIVGRQGCKIKALRAKTNTYIKTPVRGEEPIFVVTGRKEDVAMAKREIISAAEHFSMIRASRNKNGAVPGAAPGISGLSVPGTPNLPGQTTIQVRVPYRVVGLVVGPKGATIKRIQQQTHTYIVTPSRDKEPVFEVTGMPENVDRAREEIEAHIAVRTGNYIEINEENDFHSNGTDVSFDSNGFETTWGKMNSIPPARNRLLSSYRNDSSSSLGSGSTDSYFGSNQMTDFSPTSPFSAGGFWFGESFATMSSEDLGFESPAFDSLPATAPSVIWCPFEQASPIGFGNESTTGTIAHDSQPTTPRLSPTFIENIEFPLARRPCSDPLNMVSQVELPVYISAFSNGTSYSSSDGSTTSGSPTDSSGSGMARGKRDCVVCFESEVIAALVPCGHNHFCMECANRICDQEEPKCPVCNTPVTQAIRIYS